MLDPAPVSTSLPRSTWAACAVVAALLIFGLFQARQIFLLNSHLQAVSIDAAQLRQSNALDGLRLSALEAKDVSHASAKVLVAWDPYRHQGVISTQNLPSPPPGHDYQLWVLDPGAESPISAGLVSLPTGSRLFTVRPLSTPGPGFAVTLEPAGGQRHAHSPNSFCCRSCAVIR